MPFISLPSSILAYGAQNLFCMVPMVVFFSGIAYFFGFMFGSIEPDDPSSLSKLDHNIGTYFWGPIAGGTLPFLPTIWLWFWGSASEISEWTEAGDFYWNLTLFCTVLCLFTIIFTRRAGHSPLDESNWWE